MRLVTFRSGDGRGTRLGRVAGAGEPEDEVVEIPPQTARDVGQLLALADWRRVAGDASGPRHRLGDLSLAPLVPRPGKVICVGLNYRSHIEEMGRELPDAPTLFAKFASTLTGPYDEIPLPPEDDAVDWEGELVVVVGAGGRRLGELAAEQAIAGYTIADDVSMRTWQFRTKEWLQGKVWDASTPVGPLLVTADEWQPGPRLQTRVNGVEVQSAATDDLLFGPAQLVAYVSTVLTLEPGDLILTGTPGGVGRAMQPPRSLHPGDVVEVTVDGIGALRNVAVPEVVGA